MLETIIYLSATIIIAKASYHIGKTKGSYDGFEDGWDECLHYHDWDTSIHEAALNLKSEDYLECGIRRERMN